jgi:hypothetical protein
MHRPVIGWTNSSAAPGRRRYDRVTIRQDRAAPRLPVPDEAALPAKVRKTPHRRPGACDHACPICLRDRNKYAPQSDKHRSAGLRILVVELNGHRREQWAA